MKRPALCALLFAGAVLILTGCSGDMTRQLTSSPEMQTKVMDLISQNAPMAGQMVDKLMGSDSTRTLVLNRLMSDGGSMQAVMAHIAKDQTMVDGVLNLAVQDSSMKNHVMALLTGMKMGMAK